MRMGKIGFVIASLFTAVLVGVSSLTLAQGEPNQVRLDPKAIGQAAGTKAMTVPDGVVRIG